MEAARPHAVAEVAEAPPRPSLERRARDDDGDLEPEEPWRKCRRLTTSAQLSSSSIIEAGGTRVVEAEEVASKDESYARLVELAFVCVRR